MLSLQPTRAGNEFGHVCQVGLQVNVAGRPPYDVMIRQAIHVVYLPRVQPGAILPVQVDPADPQKVLLDFEGPGAPQP